MKRTSQHVIDITQANFQEEVVAGSQRVPILVDLWATWCGPCKTLGPILEEIADLYGGAFRLAKVDVDKNPQVAAAFRAQSIPMVVAIYQGRPVDQFAGALPKEKVKAFIDGVLQTCGLEVPAAQAPQAPTDPAAAEAFWQAKLAENAESGEALLALGRLAFSAARDADARAYLDAYAARHSTRLTRNRHRGLAADIHGLVIVRVLVNVIVCQNSNLSVDTRIGNPAGR